MTTPEYLRTPETLLPQELVCGFVRDACLRTHLAQEGSGHVWMSPIDVVLDREQDLVVQPDLMVVSNERRHIVVDRVWGAPDLVIEVMSPRPRIGTLDERLEWFAQYGVRECWLVRPAIRQVEVIAFAAGRGTDRRVFGPHEPIASTVLPDWSRRRARYLPLSDLIDRKGIV